MGTVVSVASEETNWTLKTFGDSPSLPFIVGDATASLPASQLATKVCGKVALCSESIQFTTQSNKRLLGIDSPSNYIPRRSLRGGRVDNDAVARS